VEPALPRLQRAVLAPDAPGLLGVVAQRLAVDVGDGLGSGAGGGELAQPRGDAAVAVARPGGEVLAQLDRSAVVVGDPPAGAADNDERGEGDG
jgi:hypothetical protein